MRGSWALGAADFSPLTILLVALVATVGALIIHNLSRRRSGGSTVADYHARSSAATLRVPVVSGDIDIPHIASDMRDHAARMELPERLLPLIALPSGADGDFVYRDGGDYVYCTVERGARTAEYRTADADSLLYRIFRDRAWTRTYMGLIGQDLSPEEHAAALAEGQRALLARADPDWADRLTREQGLAAGPATLQE